MSTSVFVFFPRENKNKMQPFIDAFCAFHNAKRHPKGGEIEAHWARSIVDQPREEDEPFVSIPTHWNKDEHTIKTMADMLEFLEKNPEFNIWEELKIEGSML